MFLWVNLHNLDFIRRLIQMDTLFPRYVPKRSFPQE
jgi:hypothetical protein